MLGPQKSTVRGAAMGLGADSFGPCMGTWSFYAWRPLPWFLSHGPPPSYPSFFPNRSKGKLSPLGLGGVALGDRLCGLLVSSPGPRGQDLAPCHPSLLGCEQPQSLSGCGGTGLRGSTGPWGSSRGAADRFLPTAKAWSYNLDTRHAQSLTQAGRHFGYRVLQVGDG